jgi:hypothetical protein
MSASRRTCRNGTPSVVSSIASATYPILSTPTRDTFGKDMILLTAEAIFKDVTKQNELDKRLFKVYNVQIVNDLFQSVDLLSAKLVRSFMTFFPIDIFGIQLFQPFKYIRNSVTFKV